jgi:hypothetical protein
MVFNHNRKVEKPVDYCVQRPLQIREHLYKVLDDPKFIIRVHQDRAGLTQTLDHPLSKGSHGWFAGQIEKLFMTHAFERAITRTVINVY